ncbi:hypothetical protein P389DRAFT_65041 [Cystobasidium minutum MCA 4210]|uniref:uncharacterized protein n=1 Tax=Cystobasidium minutum MCA 4210 TaxID=1397322 RepID=UPI0034CF784C|eukprot:jgi/Rhomi1/65041/CE65040_4695
MSSLLDRSLDDLARQDKESSRKSSSSRGRGAGSSRPSNAGGRAAPYTRRAPRPDPDADTWQHDLFKTNKLDYGDDPSSSGAADSSAAAADEGPRSTRLKVTNLHYEVSEQELRALFEQVGTLAPPAGGRETSNPAIKYDVSGRSQGEATVTYESEADAARAKQVFDNALAKGERISIAYDFTMPRRPRRQDNEVPIRGIPKSGLAGAGNPLLSRLQPAPAANKRDSFSNTRERGVRNEGSRGRGTPPARGRGAAPARGRGKGRGGRDRENKTVEDLDRELEEFMASGSKDKSAAEDIEMA